MHIPGFSQEKSKFRLKSDEQLFCRDDKCIVLTNAAISLLPRFLIIENYAFRKTNIEKSRRFFDNVAKSLPFPPLTFAKDTFFTRYANDSDYTIQ